ncbi:MAG TPA: DUF4337 family protein [Candidatus Binatia bacterium]|jgi:hypothetical protein
MPEESEIETEHLHEAIHEELEREGGSLLRRIALSTAIFAAFAAVAALEAGGTVNEALALKSDAARLQAQASDQWAHYQSRGIKKAIADAAAEAWKAADKTPPPALAQEAEKYLGEQAEIKKAAEEFEHQRDEKSAEAEELLHHHHRYADAVAMFQVSIALGAIAALTRQRSMWMGSLLVGTGALALLVLARVY